MRTATISILISVDADDWAAARALDDDSQAAVQEDVRREVLALLAGAAEHAEMPFGHVR